MSKIAVEKCLPAGEAGEKGLEALKTDFFPPDPPPTILQLLSGADIIGRARTGSGKTAAFGLPLLHAVRDGGPFVRAVVLTPTRELALQVTGALRGFAEGLPVRILTVYGGASYGPQLRALKAGVPVVVATPGRLLDLMDREALELAAEAELVDCEDDECDMCESKELL